MSQVLDVSTDQSTVNLRHPETPVEVVVSESLALHAHDHFIQAVESRVKRQPGLRWLDVGCGWHFDWRWEEQRERALLSQADVVGLDPDWQAIARHRTIEKRAVGIVERLPFGSENFDLVTANVVVEHLKHPALAFAEIFRVLRPDGVFIFRTPSARSHFVRVAKRLPQGLKTRLAAGILEDRSPEDVYPAHYLANTADEVGAICQMLGFRTTRVLITRARGALTKIPWLAGLERTVAGALGMTEGNLIVETTK